MDMTQHTNRLGNNVNVQQFASAFGETLYMTVSTVKPEGFYSTWKLGRSEDGTATMECLDTISLAKGKGAKSSVPAIPVVVNGAALKGVLTGQAMIKFAATGEAKYLSVPHSLLLTKDQCEAIVAKGSQTFANGDALSESDYAEFIACKSRLENWDK